MSKAAKPCWGACLVGERAMLQAPPVGGLLADEGHCGAIRGEKVDPASGGGEGSAVLRVGWSACTFATPCMQQLRIRTAHHCVGGVHAHTCPGTHCPRTARRPAARPRASCSAGAASRLRRISHLTALHSSAGAAKLGNPLPLPPSATAPAPPALCARSLWATTHIARRCSTWVGCTCSSESLDRLKDREESRTTRSLSALSSWRKWVAGWPSWAAAWRRTASYWGMASGLQPSIAPAIPGAEVSMAERYAAAECHHMSRVELRLRGDRRRVHWTFQSTAIKDKPLLTTPA